MKKTFIFTLICLLLFLSCIFYSCSDYYNSNRSTTTEATKSSLEKQIEALEDKILEIQQDKYLSESDSENRIRELQKEIELLKNTLTGESTSTTTNTTTEETDPKTGFTYSVDNGEAIITGYSGSEKNLVIPAKIDGYKVVSIGDSAFKGTKFETVIISSGVTEIGWFAFANSPSIKQITIPRSVTNIGYGAFDAHGTGFTISCYSDSFAKNYASSFGISYTNI